MKLFLLTFLMICISAYGKDLIPQKVILAVSEKSKNYKSELLLQKIVLSKAKNRNDLYLFSEDDTELSGYGISKVNSKLLLMFEENENYYNVILLDISKETNQISTNISIEKGKYLVKINEASENILKTIISKYPPKEKEKLVTVETLKKKVSEYEKEKPTFTLGFIASVDNLRVYDFNVSYFDNDGYWDDYHTSLKPEISFSPTTTLEFEYMWFLLLSRINLRASENYGFNINLVPLFGIAKNLLFIGPEFSYSQGHHKGFYYQISGQTISFSDFDYNLLSIGIYARFNITKNYYFDLSFGILRPYNNLSFYGTNKYFDKINIPFNSFDGPPTMNMSFNFKAFNKWIFSIDFSFYSASVKREENTDYPLVQFFEFNGQPLYLRRLSIEKSLMGIGIKYEL